MNLSTKLKQMILPLTSCAMIKEPRLFTLTNWNKSGSSETNLMSFPHLMEITPTVNSSFNTHPSINWEPKQKESFGTIDCAIFPQLSQLKSISVAMASLTSKESHCVPSWNALPVSRPSWRRLHRVNTHLRSVHHTKDWALTLISQRWCPRTRSKEWMHEASMVRHASFWSETSSPTWFTAITESPRHQQLSSETTFCKPISC